MVYGMVLLFFVNIVIMFILVFIMFMLVFKYFMDIIFLEDEEEEFDEVVVYCVVI